MAVIEKAFQESGPFDGILGFSQGAAFATILCFMQENNCKFTPHIKTSTIIIK